MLVYQRVNPKRFSDFETQRMLPQRRMPDLISGNIPIPSVFVRNERSLAEKGTTLEPHMIAS
jgi:hypothetical protein